MPKTHTAIKLNKHEAIIAYISLIMPIHLEQGLQNLAVGLELFSYPTMYFNIQYTKVPMPILILGE